MAVPSLEVLGMLVIPREGVERVAESRRHTQGPRALQVIPREGVESGNPETTRNFRPSPRVIPREGVESYVVEMSFDPREKKYVIPREGVESD